MSQTKIVKKLTKNLPLLYFMVIDLGTIKKLVSNACYVLLFHSCSLCQSVPVALLNVVHTIFNSFELNELLNGMITSYSKLTTSQTAKRCKNSSHKLWYHQP